MTLYTVAQAAEKYGLSKSLLYTEIREGRLHAKLRRGSTRPYLLTDEIMQQWWDEELADAAETN